MLLVPLNETKPNYFKKSIFFISKITLIKYLDKSLKKNNDTPLSKTFIFSTKFTSTQVDTNFHSYIY